MSISDLKNLIPDYAKDIKLNLSTLATDETLNPQQLAGTFLASARATGNQTVTKAIEAEAAQHLSDEALSAAKAAAAIMAMNNIYYKFTYIMDDYRNMPAKLRMNILGKPGIEEKADFELWSLAVSIINACKSCVIAHEQKAREEGISTAQIQTVARVASVVHAVAAVLDGEIAMNDDVAKKAA